MENSIILDPSPSAAPRLWLRVQIDAGVQIFELFANEERAIVVGSTPGAQVRITRPGVSALQFHFERDGNSVCLVPAYQGDLRINAIAAAGPCVIRENATIEFCGVCLEASVHHDTLTLPQGGATQDSQQSPASALSQLIALPEVTDPTGVAMPNPVPGAERVNSNAQTTAVRAFAPTGATPASFTTLPLTWVQPGLSPLGPQGTEPLRPWNPELDRSTPRPPARKVSEPPASTASRSSSGNRGFVVVTERIAPFAEVEGRSPAPARGQQGRADLLAQPAPTAPADTRPPIVPLPVVAVPLQGLRSVVAEPPPTRFDLPPHSALAKPLDTQETTVFDVPALPVPGQAHEHASEPCDADAQQSTGLVRRALPGAMLLFERIGTLAKARPIRVTAFALGGTLLLAALLLEASTLSQGERAHAPKARVSASVRPPPSGLPDPKNVGLAAAFAPITPTSASPPAVSAQATPAPSSASRALEVRVLRKRGEPEDPEVATAVGHYAAGRYPEAQRAYAALAARTPANPAFASIAAMLLRHSSPECSGRPSPAACPEIKQ